MISGFKAFNSNMSNRYGTKFELCKYYEVKGKISWGNSGNGVHLCSNIEDTFRYFDFMDNDSCITRVYGIGDCICNNDEYYGYYDMYVCKGIFISKIVKRNELIQYLYRLANDGYNDRALRFISGYKLTNEEVRNLLCIFDKKCRWNVEEYTKILKYYQHSK